MDKQTIINLLCKHTTEVDNFNSAVFSQDFEEVAEELLKLVTSSDVIHDVSQRTFQVQYWDNGMLYWKDVKAPNELAAKAVIKPSGKGKFRFMSCNEINVG